MVINTNIEAQTTANNLNVSQAQLAKSLSRLSSGSKIIVPSDDAAGLAVSSRLNSQIKRLDSALNNVINAVSFTQTQDGFMKTIDKAFRRMGELAMLAQDTTKSDEDRALYNQEFAQLKDYVNETSKQDFNGVSLFAGRSMDVTVDANGTTFSMVGIDLEADVYNTAINSGVESWHLTSDAYKLSKDGYELKAAAYKTSVALWRDSLGNWSATDNGGTKFATGSIVSDTISSSLDAGVKTLSANTFVASTVKVNGFTTNFLTNKLTKSGHGLVTGDSIKLSGSVPSGTDASTTYYVNVSGNDITLHNTKDNATAGTSAVDLGNTVSGATWAASTDNLTKTSHGLESGDVVQLSSIGGATGASTYTNYYVKKLTADTLELYTDNALTGANKVLVSADGTDVVMQGARLTGASWSASSDTVTKTAHGLNTGDKVKVTSDGGATGATTYTDYYVKKLSADTFDLYSDSAMTTKVVVSTDGADVRLNLEGTSGGVNAENLNNLLKKGYYILANPITTGEDTKAVKTLKGQDVVIDQSTQDISAFATRNDTTYYDDVNLKSVVGSQVALDLVKKAITQVATDRAKLGAVQSRLNFTNDQLTVTKENLSAAISRIADVDVAEEATQYARFQILVASGTEMLKQANQLPQSALQLLK